MDNKSFDVALNEFLSVYTEFIHARYERDYPSLGKPSFEASVRGPKFVGVVAIGEAGSSRSRVCFIRRADGAILKGSWKAPERPFVERGNIFSELHGMEAFSPSGHIRYLK